MNKKEPVCTNCKKPIGSLPHSICWECGRPLCRACGGMGNAAAILMGIAYMNKKRCLVCKHCFLKGG
jgi:predicted amidophosphoribosyltransferase